MNSEMITNKMAEKLLLNLKEKLECLPTVTISRCLMGDLVRYDGSHKSLEQLRSPLARFLELKPFCPEIAAGMGVPRKPIQWVESDAGELRLQQVDAPQLKFDQTLSDTCADWLTGQPTLDAGILKARSPSCGSGSTPIYSTSGQKLRDSDGQWAISLKQAYPNIWLIDEEQCAGLDKVYAVVTALYLQQLQRQTPKLGLSRELQTVEPRALLSQNSTENTRIYQLIASWLNQRPTDNSSSA